MKDKNKKKSKWILKQDIPSCGAKKGMVFEWNIEEDAYTTKEMPWMLTPMFPYYEITNKKWFKREELK